MSDDIGVPDRAPSFVIHESFDERLVAFFRRRVHSLTEYGYGGTTTRDSRAAVHDGTPRTVLLGVGVEATPLVIAFRNLSPGGDTTPCHEECPTRDRPTYTLTYQSWTVSQSVSHPEVGDLLLSYVPLPRRQ